MANRPNILFIPHRRPGRGRWVRANREIITPHLDRLASEGAYLPNFFCASPVCLPARADPGRGCCRRSTASTTGSDRQRAADRCPKPFMDDTQAIEYLAGLPTYPQILADNGLRVRYSSKWHLGDSCGRSRGSATGRSSPRRQRLARRADPARWADGDRRRLSDRCHHRRRAGLPRSLRGGRGALYLSVHYTAPHSPWDGSAP